MKAKVFIAGGTGYLGAHVIPVLLSRGHEVTVLTRKGSEGKVPAGCKVVIGDALSAESYARNVTADHTFLHLVGVPHPNPRKAALFRSIDLPAAMASLSAAKQAGVLNFVYLSVAHPASVMKAYIETRMEAEAAIRESGLPATFLRPWYVLGPGHRWAYALIPFYKLMELFPGVRDSAIRLGLVTLPQMIAAMVNAIENPATGVRTIDVPQIRKSVLSPNR